MSILNNEGHDPQGFGNTPACRETRNEIATLREKQLADALAKIERLTERIERLRAVLKEIGACEPRDCQASAGWDALRAAQAKAHAALTIEQQTGLKSVAAA